MCSSLLLLALALAALVVFLSLAAVKSETFNRASLRRLRENDRDLSDRLEEFLLHAPRRRLTGHLALLAAVVALAVTLAAWHLRASIPPVWKAVAIAAFPAAIFTATEILDATLGLKAAALLLRAVSAFTSILFWPFAFLLLPLEALARAHRRNADPDTAGQVTAEDEIRSLLEDDDTDAPHADSGVSAPIDDLESDEKRMLNGVINLDKTLVHEIMTPRVDIDAIREDTTIDEAKRAIARSGHSRIPVFEKSIDAISGILYAKDLLDETRIQGISSLKDLLHPPVFIPETKNVSDLLDEFRKAHIHIAVVLDEYGGTSGLVTIEDILEEIVGEIQDEYDRDEPPPGGATPQPDGSLTADARMTIWEVNQALDLEISEEEGYDTLGGYIMAALGRIPRTGEHLETPDLVIDILSASPRKLNTVKIRRAAADGTAPRAS